MSRKYVIAGNWKMNKLASEVPAFASELKAALTGAYNCDIVVCAPYPLIPALNANKDVVGMGVGAEDVSAFEKGAYTGEVSVSQLKELGPQYCIVGHSERRQYHNETDSSVNAKVKALLANDIIPIVCVGESLKQRECGLTKDFVNSQVVVAFSGLSAEDAKKCIIAYEPIWAIGTGVTATNEQAQEACKDIREELARIYDAETADSITIQYGGSMNDKNADELLQKTNVDGGLIGGASLVAEKFAAIVSAATRN